MEKELEYLGDALRIPKRPFVAILGGAKISGKIDVIEALLPKVDRAARRRRDGVHVLQGAWASRPASRSSKPDRVELAKALLERGGDTTDAAARCDGRAGARAAGSAAHAVARDAIPADEAMFDIGPRHGAVVRARDRRGEDDALERTDGRVRDASRSTQGTRAIADAMAEATSAGRDDDRRRRRFGGGGRARPGSTSAMSHVSTGGGASLEFLEGKTLPGVAALDDE